MATRRTVAMLAALVAAAIPALGGSTGLPPAPIPTPIPTPPRWHAAALQPMFQRLLEGDDDGGGAFGPPPGGGEEGPPPTPPLTPVPTPTPNSTVLANGTTPMPTPLPTPNTTLPANGTTPLPTPPPTPNTTLPANGTTPLPTPPPTPNSTWGDIADFEGSGVGSFGGGGSGGSSSLESSFEGSYPTPSPTPPATQPPAFYCVGKNVSDLRLALAATVGAKEAVGYAIDHCIPFSAARPTCNVTACLPPTPAPAHTGSPTPAPTLDGADVAPFADLAPPVIRRAAGGGNAWPSGFPLPTAPLVDGTGSEYYIPNAVPSVDIDFDLNASRLLARVDITAWYVTRVAGVRVGVRLDDGADFGGGSAAEGGGGSAAAAAAADDDGAWRWYNGSAVASGTNAVARVALPHIQNARYVRVRLARFLLVLSRASTDSPLLLCLFPSHFSTCLSKVRARPARGREQQQRHLVGSARHRGAGAPGRHGPRVLRRRAAGGRCCCVHTECKRRLHLRNMRCRKFRRRRCADPDAAGPAEAIKGRTPQFQPTVLCAFEGRRVGRCVVRAQRSRLALAS